MAQLRSKRFLPSVEMTSIRLSRMFKSIGQFLALSLLLGTVLWLAFWGWIIYLILKLFAPRTAASIKETISGRPAI